MRLTDEQRVVRVLPRGPSCQSIRPTRGHSLAFSNLCPSLPWIMSLNSAASGPVRIAKLSLMKPTLLGARRLEVAAREKLQDMAEHGEFKSEGQPEKELSKKQMLLLQPVSLIKMLRVDLILPAPVFIQLQCKLSRTPKTPPRHAAVKWLCARPREMASEILLVCDRVCLRVYEVSSQRCRGPSRAPRTSEGKNVLLILIRLHVSAAA